MIGSQSHVIMRINIELYGGAFLTSPAWKSWRFPGSHGNIWLHRFLIHGPWERNDITLYAMYAHHGDPHVPVFKKQVHFTYDYNRICIVVWR